MLMIPEFTSPVHGFPLSSKIIYPIAYLILLSGYFHFRFISEAPPALCGKTHLFCFPNSHLLLPWPSPSQQVAPPPPCSLQLSPSISTTPCTRTKPFSAASLQVLHPVRYRGMLFMQFTTWDAGSTSQQIWNLFCFPRLCRHSPSPSTTSLVWTSATKSSLLSSPIRVRSGLTSLCASKVCQHFEWHPCPHPALFAEPFPTSILLINERPLSLE